VKYLVREIAGNLLTGLITISFSRTVFFGICGLSHVLCSVMTIVSRGRRHLHCSVHIGMGDYFFYNIFRKINLFWEIRANYCVLFRVSTPINKSIRLKHKTLNCIHFIASFDKSKTSHKPLFRFKNVTRKSHVN
jgi:hypothetical protein